MFPVHALQTPIVHQQRFQQPQLVPIQTTSSSTPIAIVNTKLTQWMYITTGTGTTTAMGLDLSESNTVVYLSPKYIGISLYIVYTYILE